MAEYANRFLIPHHFEVGDNVWLSTKNLAIPHGSGSRRLQPKNCGPFVITKKIHDVTFQLDLSEPMK